MWSLIHRPSSKSSSSLTSISKSPAIIVWSGRLQYMRILVICSEWKLIYTEELSQIVVDSSLLETSFRFRTTPVWTETYSRYPQESPGKLGLTDWTKMRYFLLVHISSFWLNKSMSSRNAARSGNYAQTDFE
jgi:hypothetical protein